MDFEWDPLKNLANIRKHGLRFETAVALFDAPMLVELDERYDYDEERFVGIGKVRGRVLVVVYTERNGEKVRIISLRKALRNERLAYEDLFGK